MSTESHKPKDSKGYFAVIFSTKRTGPDPEYDKMGEKIYMLAIQQPGFIAIDSVTNAEGDEITVSYWESMEAIRNWKQLREHLEAQKLGKEKWYGKYHVRVCEMKYEYSFGE